MKLRIKDLRLSANLTQDEAANRMNVSMQTYQRFEKSISKVDIDRLEDFAKVIGMSVVDVISYPDKYVNVGAKPHVKEVTVRVTTIDDINFIQKLYEIANTTILSYEVK